MVELNVAASVELHHIVVPIMIITHYLPRAVGKSCLIDLSQVHDVGLVDLADP